MRRRTLLASLAAGTAGLAGCSFASGETPATDDESTPTDGSEPTETPSTETPADDATEWPEPPEQSASVVDLETVARTYAFHPTQLRTDDEAEVALWFDRTATDDHPARLRGWLRNDNSFENTFQIEWIPPVGRTFSRQPDGYDHEARLHVVPTENNGLTAGTPALAQTDDGLWYARDSPDVPETYRMAPGERVALEYHVVGERGAPGRPTGTYEFRGDDETARITVWDTDSPGPDATSRFAGRTLPELSGETAVQWYHEADTGTEAFVEPSAERLELDGLVSFEMVNNSAEMLRCGHWNLHKLVDGEWFHVAPSAHTADCRGLPPGGRIDWSLRAFNGEAVPCGRACGRDGLTQGYLGGGEYAVVAGYGHPADESAALVELVGDRVDVVPTEDVRRERDGDTVVVTADRYGDGEHPPDATLSLTRAASASDRLIAEQVMAQPAFGAAGRGLRNALGSLPADAERVVLRTDDHVVDGAVGYDTDVRRFRFRGQAYEVRRGERD